MKKISIIISSLLVTITLHAQVGIGGKTDFTGSSALLDFGTEAGATVDGSDAGAIVIKPNNGLPADATNGLIAMVDNGSNTSFEYFENGAWVSLGSGPTGSAVTGADRADAHAIIGATTSTATGALILESSDQALVLPQIANGRFKLKPTPGMTYYDTIDKTIYIHDGEQWNAL